MLGLFYPRHEQQYICSLFFLEWSSAPGSYSLQRKKRECGSKKLVKREDLKKKRRNRSACRQSKVRTHSQTSTFTVQYSTPKIPAIWGGLAAMTARRHQASKLFSFRRRSRKTRTTRRTLKRRNGWVASTVESVK